MKKQSGSAHLFVIVGILIVVIGALGFVFWNNSKPSDAGGVTTQGVSHSEPIAQAPSSWVAYHGDALPVTFTYPSDWEIVEIPGAKGGAIKAFRGPERSGSDMVFAILYRNDPTAKINDSCTAAGIERAASCEKYTTKTMSGLLERWDEESGFMYSSHIGGDVYAFVSYNHFVSREDFKSILSSVELR